VIDIAWEIRAAQAIRNRTDASILRERADVVVRFLLGRALDEDPQLAEALSSEGIDASTGRTRCREMFDIALFGGRLHPYQILGLEQAASDTVIKEQYKRLVQLYHPDRSDDFDTDLANDRLVRLREARDQMLAGKPELASAPRQPDRRAQSRPRSDTGNRRRAGVRPESTSTGYSQYTQSQSKPRRDYGYDAPSQPEPERAQPPRSEKKKTSSASTTSASRESKHKRKGPSRLSRFFAAITGRHRPNSAAVSGIMLCLAGAGALVLFLQNRPDIDWTALPRAENASEQTLEKPQSPVVDMLAGYPEVKQLLDIFEGAYTRGNTSLLLQQFGPDAVVNDIQGVAAIEALFKAVFAREPNTKLTLVVNATGVMGDGLLLVEGDATRELHRQSGVPSYETTRFRMRTAHQAGRLRILSLENEALKSSGN